MAERIAAAAIADRAGLTLSALSRRSGVSRNTIHRADTGRGDLTLRTLRELAIAAGMDVDVRLVPLSDPDAAAGARVLLGEDIPDELVDDDVRAWVARLRRMVPESNPVKVVLEAGAAVAPRARVGAIGLDGTFDELKLAAAAESAGGRWAMSGAPALRRLADDAPDAPVILHADEPAAVVRYLAPMRDAPTSIARVIVVPLTPIVLVDSAIDERIRLVAPVQALLDSVALGGPAAQTALMIAERW